MKEDNNNRGEKHEGKNENEKYEKLIKLKEEGERESDNDSEDGKEEMRGR